MHGGESCRLPPSACMDEMVQTHVIFIKMSTVVRKLAKDQDALERIVGGAGDDQLQAARLLVAWLHKMVTTNNAPSEMYMLGRNVMDLVDLLSRGNNADKASLFQGE